MTPHTLVLLRHGSAESARAGQRDADRPLSKDGAVEAATAGAWLSTHGLLPDLVLCSPARRTVQTWERAAAAAGILMPAAATAFEPLLYSQGVEAVLNLVAGIPDEVSTVLIVGHNPTVSIASALLAPPFDGHGLPTAGLAVHRSPASWADWPAQGAPLVLSNPARNVTHPVPSPNQGTGPVTT